MAQARQTRVVEAAARKVGDTSWSLAAVRRSPQGNFGSYEPKCNLFVAEMLAEGGFDVPLKDASPSRRTIITSFREYFSGQLEGKRPPKAEEWFEGTVAETTLVGEGLAAFPRCWPGDIICSMSHVGIVQGVRSTISASTSGEVVQNDWGWRKGEAQSIRIFRYHP